MKVCDADLTETNSDVDMPNNPFRESSGIYEKLYDVIKSTFDSNRVRVPRWSTKW